MEDIPEYTTKTELPRFKAQDSIDDETEDEEVKLNCIGGLRGYQESDLSSDTEEEDEEEGWLCTRPSQKAQWQCQSNFRVHPTT